jgi:ubiquinone/menaquinone biosynthesis C-methylase UbiE
MNKDNFAHKASDWDSPQKMGMTSKFVEEMLRNVEPIKSMRILEIGTGTGLVGLQILPKVKSAVFVDTSESMLNVLRQKLEGNEPIEIIHGEIFEYQKKDIDLIFSAMAFHHLTDMDSVLKHLYNITLPGAQIVVGDIRTEDGSFHNFEPIPHKGFDTDEVELQFTNAGFKIKSCYTYNLMKKELVPGTINEYEQFILVAQKDI